MQISTIGIDIGRNSFHFVGFDARGGIVVRRQCSRTQHRGQHVVVDATAKRQRPS
jgi:hypothetical protein